MLAAAAIDGFADDVRSACARATEQGTHDVSLTLAGRRVSLRFAGRPLRDAYLPALAHLAVHDDSGSRANLSVWLWERASTKVGPPRPPWSLDDFLAGGRIRGLVRERVRVTYDVFSRTLTVYDAERSEAYVHVADADDVPPWMTRAPIRNVLSWWAADCGLAFVHASALADDRGAVVLAGPSGCGKSTTALTGFAAGLRFLGDDACLVDLTGPVPVVHPVYRFAKLERDALNRVPSMRALVADPEADQLVVAVPDGSRPASPLRALVLPRIADRADSMAVPVTRREALRAVVASTLLEGDGAGGTGLRALTALCAGTNSFRLDLGSRPAGVVDAINGLLGS